MSIKPTDIRNIAVIGHSGEGKTTLCEAMLFNGGAIDRMGKVTDGTTVMDYDDLEKAKKSSVYTSVAYLIWKGVKINLLDLPGFYDFEGERREGLTAAGGALLVIGANGSIPVGAESVVETCRRMHKPLVIFINGMDKDNADYVGTVRALRERYPGKIAPIQIPIMTGGKMTGFVNALQDKAYRFSSQGPQEIPIPDDMISQTEEMQYSLMETAAENDDGLLDKYFETGHLTREEAIHGIRKGIASINTVPVLAGSALQNRGVINLLNEIVRYMPTAEERSGVFATDLDLDQLVSVNCEEDAPFAAQVFKTVSDPYSGKLNYIKVFRGNLRSGMTVKNSKTGKEERIGQIYLLRGKKNELVTELTAGDIGAVNKLSETNTNDTLCDVSTNILFDPITFPKPTLSIPLKRRRRANSSSRGREKYSSTSSAKSSNSATASASRWQSRRSPTRRPSDLSPTPKASTKSSRADTDNTDTARYASNPAKRNSSSKRKSSAAQFPSNTSPPSKRDCANAYRKAPSRAIPSRG